MAGSDNKPEVWWKKGVCFSCIGCGRCCRGEPGAIFFTLDEEDRIAAYLALDKPDFRKLYVTLKWGHPSFVEHRNGDCIFYDAEKAKCKIYPLRPAQCALFPFWPSVMESRKEWDRQARHCPGMNKGDFHSAEEIEDRLAESPFKDL